MFKKIKFCFKTSDYEGLNLEEMILVILDKSRGYYGIKFCIDSSDINYGLVTCFNSGNEYNSHYFDRTFYNFVVYHRHPTWDKNVRPRIFCFNKYSIRKPLDVQEK